MTELQEELEIKRKVMILEIVAKLEGKKGANKHNK